MTRKLMAVFSLPINWFTILHTVLYNTLIYYQMPFTVYTNTVNSRDREISKAGHSRQMSRNVTCLEAKKCCLLPCGYVPVQLHFDTTRAYKSWIFCMSQRHITRHDVKQCLRAQLRQKRRTVEKKTVENNHVCVISSVVDPDPDLYCIRFQELCGSTHVNIG